MLRLPSILLRCLLGVWLLSGCTLYHKVFRPYRLPTPKPSPEFIAQQKAKKEKEKAALVFSRDTQKKSKTKGGTGEEAATDVSVPGSGAMNGDNTPAAATEARTLPERSTVRYDKNGLMKKAKLKRRRVNKTSKPFRPWQSVRHFFKFGLHAKPNYDPDHKPAPRAPKDAPEPSPAPDGKQ